MRHTQRLLHPLSALLILLLFAGCGPTLPSGTNDLPPTTPLKTSSASSSTTMPTPRADSITVQIDKSLYRTHDTISVTVSNQSNQTISFPDHLTNCTVILLQRQKAQPQTSDLGQVGINPCLLMIATRMHTLLPGQHLVVPLVASKSGWPPGLYLATLSYHTASTAGSPTTISSTAFTVGSPGTQP